MILRILGAWLVIDSVGSIMWYEPRFVKDLHIDLNFRNVVRLIRLFIGLTLIGIG